MEHLEQQEQQTQENGRKEEDRIRTVDDILNYYAGQNN